MECNVIYLHFLCHSQKSAVCNIKCTLANISDTLGIPSLPTLLSNFLHEQLTIKDLNAPFMGKVFLYPSAVAMYYAPSDKSGIGRMLHEWIQSIGSWYGGPPRHDCIFISHDENLPSFRGLYVGQVLALLRVVTVEKIKYPAALISLFETTKDHPCLLMNMWKVQQVLDNAGKHMLKIVHLDTMFHGAHLVGGSYTSPWCIQDFLH